MSVDALNILARIIDGDMPPEALPWLQDGFRRYMRGDAGLEVALRLTGANRIRARNAALLRAAEILDGERGLPPYELAGLLEHAVHHYETTRRHDASLSPLNAAIRDAFAAGARMIRSRRRLYELLRD